MGYDKVQYVRVAYSTFYTPDSALQPLKSKKYRTVLWIVLRDMYRKVKGQPGVKIKIAGKPSVFC